LAAAAGRGQRANTRKGIPAYIAERGENMNERLARVTAAMRAHGLDAALLSSPHNVCYVSGYEVPIEAGPSAFAGGPDLALVDADGRVTLIVPDLEASAARAAAQVDAVVSYAAFGHLERYDQPANLWHELVRALRQSNIAGGTLGIEPLFLPAYLERAIRAGFEAFTIADATAALAEARLVKTADEIDRLRLAVDLTAAGQNAARLYLAPGMSEIALFTRVRGAMEEAAGHRVAIAGDTVSGADRTANAGGWPSDRIIEEHDLVIADLAPRFDGYWGDSCNTLCAGEPTAQYRRMIQATTEALAKAVEAARPGLRASELDAVCRGHVESFGYVYGHHSGHALGTTVHEAPRLVPYEQMPLQAGMVLAVEPGAYVPGVGGIRTEHVILITESGADVLSSFPHGL
jgi:Xaa-Pro dipeptidase